MVEESWCSSPGLNTHGVTDIVEQSLWYSHGGTVIVEQPWWNSLGETVFVEQLWWTVILEES